MTEYNIIMYSGRKKFLDAGDTFNLGIKYLHENTRFSLDSYDKNLTADDVEAILSIIYSSGFKTNNRKMYANISSYAESGCSFVHDGEKIHIELPAINIDMLSGMIIMGNVLKPTRDMVMLLYGSCTGHDPEFLISKGEDCSVFDCYYDLTDDYKLAFIKYVYKNIGHPYVIWSEDECKKFLKID